LQQCLDESQYTTVLAEWKDLCDEFESRIN